MPPEGANLYKTFTVSGLQETKYDSLDEVAHALNDIINASQKREQNYILSVGTVRSKEKTLNEALRVRLRINPDAVAVSHEYTSFLTGARGISEVLQDLEQLVKRKESMRTKQLRKLFVSMDTEGKGFLTIRSVFQILQDPVTSFERHLKDWDL